MLFFSILNLKLNKRKGNALFNDLPPDLYSKAELEKRAPYAAFRIKGSLTVEASFVIPIFIAAITMLIFFLQAIRIQQHIQKALFNQTMQVAGYAYYINETDIADMAEQFLEGEYIKSQIIKELGEDFFDEAYIVNGSKGIVLNFSGINDEGIIDAALQYKLEIPFDIFKIGGISFVSRARCKTWVGTESEKNEWSAEMVYVTANGEVYHTDKNCSYINSQIQSCIYFEIESKRNSSGAIYYPCSLCCGMYDNKFNDVYFTPYGTRYHMNRLCSNIKSSVFAIEKEDAQKKYRLCTKCEEGGGTDD